MYRIINKTNNIEDITIDKVFPILRATSFVVYKTNTSLRVLRKTDQHIDSKHRYSFVDLVYNSNPPTYCGNTIEESIQRAINDSVSLLLFSNFNEFNEALKNNLIH
jgi:hypothetical protein